MSEWKETTLGNVINLKRGYDLPESQRLEGGIPIYSSSGISGFHNSCKSLSPGVITGRYGTIGKVFLSNTPFWPLNTTLYVQDFKGNDEVFIYYFLNKIDWTKFNDKSAVPGVNRNDLHQEDVLLPPLAEQKKIADLLSCLDAKIDNLRRQNETLEEIARSIFKHWFIDFEFPNPDGKPYKSSGGAMVRSDLGDIPEGWRVGNLGEIIINYDRKRVPLSSIERQEKKGKYPYYGAASIMDYVDDYLFDGLYILMGEDGTVIDDTGYPILQYVSGKFWANNHAHVLQGKGEYFTNFIYLFLKRTRINNIVTGAVQPKINQANMNAINLVIPNIQTLNYFKLIVSPIFERIIVNILQIQTLTKTRDALLPKLMSGQLRVKE